MKFCNYDANNAIKLCVENDHYQMKLRGTSSTPIWSKFRV